MLRWLYSHLYVTVGKEKIVINKGVMQGSILSPALFNIYIEDLLSEILLNTSMTIDDVFAYADDIAFMASTKI